MAKQSSLHPQVLRPGDPMDEWDRFVDESPQGCVFCRSWWLDAVAPRNFQILLLRNGERIVAGMPLVQTRKWNLRVVHMPQLTQTLGPLLARPTSNRYEKQLSAEMEILALLETHVPPSNYFQVCFHSRVTNWLPFHWAGYQQTTRYSYAIEGLGDIERVVAGFAHSKRKNIRRAERLVDVRQDMPPGDFYEHHVRTLRQQGEVISYSRDLFERVHRATYAHGAGKTWYAIDADGNVHAGVFVVHDVHRAYYLISTIDPAFRDSGAATLLVLRAMEHAAKFTDTFDFEGSMMQSVERSFRKFGARQTPYFCITKGRWGGLVRAVARIASRRGWMTRLLGLRR